MSNKLQKILQLLPVRTVPFFACGIILCACGGITAVVMMIAAATAALLAFRFRKTLFASALALLFGMISVTSYIQLVCVPLQNYDGTIQRLTLHITEEYESTGYSYYECNTIIANRPTSLRFYAGQEYAIGDILDADVKLTAIPRNHSAARQTILNASLKEVYNVLTPAFCLSRCIADYRNALQSEIYSYIGGDVGALAQGLLFGNTGGFSTKLYHAAKISGVVHFTAVSGSHFVIIMSVLLELAGDRKRLRSLLAVMLIPLAVIFFGGEPSVVRAGITVFLCNCGPLFSRKAESINSLCIAIFIMTAFTPYVMLDIGFQMSVLGVFGVSVVGPRLSLILRRYTRKLPDLLRSSIDAMAMSACAVICIAPISVPAFGGISLIGVLATLVLTPVFTAALTLAVIFAVTGLTPLLFPLGLLIKVAYHIILFFGSNPLLWMATDFPAAGILALIAAVSLIVAVIFYDESRDIGHVVLVLSVTLFIGLTMMSSSARRKIEFTSNGTSGAALFCVKNEAAVFVCGTGARLADDISDQLLRNGTHSIKHIFATDLDDGGINTLLELSELYPIEAISTNPTAAETLSDVLPNVDILLQSTPSWTIDGITLACAKAGNTDISADIIMYSGYKLSEPAHNANIPIYVSSRQDILPENGINIYDTQYEIELKEYQE